ncbi:aldo/keto reductase [Acidovorax sp. Be4]|uniref:Aldo/keto reductase n=1 Tax=Acidovorax bellezanensis TaxID=2976702 RepID=A0ABT2PST3_9BURK|nr:aldo/keto reductase [Acidovorax sp. Be4]MCT9812168.1 aldo/keto reductase [Acidovorax sp. Be4]
MQTRKIGSFDVTSVGLGCMNLNHAYGTPPSAEQGRELLAHALDRGVTLFDTAALYGFGANESLVGPVLAPHRDRITLCSKGGMAGVVGDDGVTRRVIDGRPATLRRNCEDSLKRLGTDVIDLYYLHRWDKSVPIEESVGEMGRLLQEGKVRALGLSEVSVETLDRAHREHPITALQSEYSLWSRNAELGTLQRCAELGIAYVAFSPLGRGFLGGILDAATLGEKDVRSAMPRFSAENYARNVRLLAPMREIAEQADCSLATLAIAWVLRQGEHVIALPGTTQRKHLDEDLRGASVKLTAEQLEALDRLFQPSAIAGHRYALQGQKEVDTEEFTVAA